MSKHSGHRWSWEDKIVPIFDIDKALDPEDTGDGDTEDEDEDYIYELTALALDGDLEPMGSHDGSDDGDALASAGFGTDEDYGCFSRDEDC